MTKVDFRAKYDIFNKSLYIQWGSEYKTSLVFEWSKTVCLMNGSVTNWWLDMTRI